MSNPSLEIELEREREKVRALQEIGAALSSTLDLDELLNLVLERISQVIDAERATLYLLDEEAGEVWSKVAQGAQVKEIRLKVGEGIAGWVAKTGKALNIEDAYKDPRFDADWDQKTGYRTRSILCVPMKNQHGRTMGVVQVLNKTTGVTFTHEDEGLLVALASQAAVTVENSKLFLSVVNKNIELLETKEQLERKVREQDLLFEIAQVSASAAKLDDLLEGVVARAMRAVEAEAGAILISDADSGELRFRSAVGGVPNAVKKVRIQSGEGIAGWVAKHGVPQIVNDVASDARHSQGIATQTGYHPKTILCVPLKWEGGNGALELLNKFEGRDHFSADDLRLVTMIAGHISTAIGLARARERRERQERLSTIGQLMSSVLHDLKTPMTVLSGYVQLLVTETDEASRKRYAETALRQIDFISAMTRETLSFAKGESQLWVRKVYLQRFFEEMVEILRRGLEGRDIDLQLDLQDKGVGRFDQQKLQRALHNLVRNAAEAIGDRGGVIRITVSRRDSDGALQIEVHDNGPGIPDEVRGRLFESFATHGKSYGTGLGLAIVRKMVADHGGQVEVQSEPGSTTFSLFLPDAQESGRATGSTEAPATLGK